MAAATLRDQESAHIQVSRSLLMRSSSAALNAPSDQFPAREPECLPLQGSVPSVMGRISAAKIASHQAVWLKLIMKIGTA